MFVSVWMDAYVIKVTVSFSVKVTRSVDTGDGEMSPQEEQTIKAIVDARSSLTDKCKSFKLA
jgi:hypothetical protein